MDQCGLNIHKTPQDITAHGVVPCHRERGHEGECKGFWRLVLEARGRGEISRGELLEVIDALTIKPVPQTPKPEPEYCPHCNGYGSSLKEDSDRCSVCGGTGRRKA